MHAAGVIHRDLKPSNIMLTADVNGYRATLIDFGIAKLVDPESGASLGQTRTDELFGTPQCMAPEQIDGRRVDPRTDVYALGVVLYYMVTGMYPFSAGSVVETRAMHLTHPPPNASDSSPVPAALDAVIQRCMAKEPTARYSRALDVIKDLRAAMPPDRRAGEASYAGIGAFLAIRAQSPDDADSDDVFEAIERMVETVQRRLLSVGLVPILETGRDLLAVALLPEDPEVARATRRRVLDCAVGLTAALLSPDSRIQGHLTVHVAPVSARVQPDSVEYLDGPLLRPDQWCARSAHPAPVATPASLGDLAPHFEVQPASGESSELMLIYARRSR
jgi:serine/threonine-protein kinase